MQDPKVSKQKPKKGKEAQNPKPKDQTRKNTQNSKKGEKTRGARKGRKTQSLKNPKKGRGEPKTPKIPKNNPPKISEVKLRVGSVRACAMEIVGQNLRG